MDALYSLGEPLVGERAVIREREGGAAELGECEDKLVPDLRPLRASWDRPTRLPRFGSTLLGGGFLGPGTDVAEGTKVARSLARMLACERLMVA